MIIIIPGPLMDILTFPGVILHEMAHKFFCDHFNIKVSQVKYFSFGGISGSGISGIVHHEHVSNENHNAIIALSPLLINSLAALIISMPYISILLHGADFVEELSFIDYFLIWVAFSCGFASLPSSTDLNSISDTADPKYIFIKKIISFFNHCEWVGSLLWMLLLLSIIALISTRFIFVCLYINRIY